MLNYWFLEVPGRFKCSNAGVNDTSANKNECVILRAVFIPFVFFLQAARVTGVRTPQSPD